MTTDNTTPSGQAANRAAYARLSNELAAWRKKVLETAEAGATCSHEFTTRICGLQVCVDCGRILNAPDVPDIDN